MEKQLVPVSIFIKLLPFFSADILTKSTYGLANNNTLILKINGDIIDKVGWEKRDFEELTGIKPRNTKASSGNFTFDKLRFIDTDNNANDFEIQTCPSPKAPSKLVTSNRACAFCLCAAKSGCQRRITLMPRQ